MKDTAGRAMLITPLVFFAVGVLMAVMLVNRRRRASGMHRSRSAGDTTWSTGTWDASGFDASDCSSGSGSADGGGGCDGGGGGGGD